MKRIRIELSPAEAVRLSAGLNEALLREVLPGFGPDGGWWRGLAAELGNAAYDAGYTDAATARLGPRAEIIDDEEPEEETDE